jgi:hypothetical protein
VGQTGGEPPCAAGGHGGSAVRPHQAPGSGRQHREGGPVEGWAKTRVSLLHRGLLVRGSGQRAGIRRPGTSAIAHARELLERIHVRRSQVGPWLGQKRRPGQVTVVGAITSWAVCPLAASSKGPVWSGSAPGNHLGGEGRKVGEGKAPTLWQGRGGKSTHSVVRRRLRAIATPHTPHPAKESS